MNSSKVLTPKIVVLDGGRAPIKIIEEFISKLVKDPSELELFSDCNQKKWSIHLNRSNFSGELSIILKGRGLAPESSLYLGLPLCYIPVRDSVNFMVTILELANTLVSAQVGLISNTIVLGTSMPIFEVSSRCLLLCLDSLIEQYQASHS
jgi:hypothetical protein